MVAAALGTGDGHRAVLAADLPAPLRADPDPAAVPASVDHHQDQPPHRDQRPAQLTRARVLSRAHRAQRRATPRRAPPRRTRRAAATTPPPASTRTPPAPARKLRS